MTAASAGSALTLDPTPEGLQLGGQQLARDGVRAIADRKPHCNEKANGGGKHVLSQFCFAALGQNPSSLQAGGLSPSPNVKRAMGAAEGLRQVRGTLADHRARGPSYLTSITAGTASMRAQSFA